MSDWSVGRREARAARRAAQRDSDYYCDCFNGGGFVRLHWRDCGPFRPGPHQAAPPCLHSAPACANVFDVTGVLGVGRRAQRGEQPNATVTTTATVSMAAASSASTARCWQNMKTWQRSGRYAANVFVTRHWSVGRRSGAAAGAASGALMLSTGDAESGSAGDVSVAVGSSGAGGSLSLSAGSSASARGGGVSIASGAGGTGSGAVSIH